MEPIENDIKNAIDRVGKFSVERKKRDAAVKGSDWRKEIWRGDLQTKEVLSSLTDLAHKWDYKAAASKKIQVRDRPGWLYDLVWYRGETGKLSEVILAAECQWAIWSKSDKTQLFNIFYDDVECQWAKWSKNDKIRLYNILYNFEKLLVARTKYKVIFIEGFSDFIKNTFDVFKQSVKLFKQSDSGDRYLFVGWDWGKQEFVFEHFVYIK